MKRAMKTLVFLLFVPHLAAAQEKTGAQPEAERWRGHPPSLFTLTAQPVQKELRLSPEQAARIANLGQEYARSANPRLRRVRHLRQGADSLATEARDDAIAKIHAELNRQSQRYEERALQVLDATQKARLTQLRLQARGVWILFDPGIRQQLRLSDSQIQRITALVRSCEVECRSIAHSVELGKTRPQVAMEKVRRLRRGARRDALQELSLPQRTQLDAVLGPKPPYEPTELRLRLVTRNEP